VILQVLDDVHAANDRRRELPKRRENEVVGPERERAAHLGRLLPFEGRIDRQLTLSLQRHAFAVESARSDHQPQEIAQPFVVEADLGVAGRRSVRREDLNHRNVVDVAAHP
jgi:hypothetical protein